MLEKKPFFKLPSWDVEELLTKQGRRVLDQMLEQGAVGPSQELVAEVEAHLMLRFGHTRDLDWYLCFCIEQGGFVANLIPPRQYSLEVYPFLNMGLAEITEVKTFAHKILPTDQLLDIGYQINGNFYNRDYKLADYDELLKHVGSGNLVMVKSDNSRNGLNSMLVDVNDYVNAPHNPGTDWVVQRYLPASPEIAKLAPGRMMAIRITTMRNFGAKITSPSAELVIGGERPDFDNYGPLIRVLITDQDGHLDSVGFDEDYAKHYSASADAPRFAGQQIDHFDTALSFVSNLHRNLPHFDLLSWDLMIDEKGVPWIYEWSGDHVDITLSQLRAGVVLEGLRAFDPERNRFTDTEEMRGMFGDYDIEDFDR